MVTHSFRKSYSTLKTIHKNKYPTASMDSIELHGVRVDEKQLKILIHIAKLRVQAENVVFYSRHIHAYACICMHRHAYPCICMHMHAYARLCMHIHAYACIGIQKDVYACICMHRHA